MKPIESGYEYGQHEPEKDDSDCPEGGKHDLRDTGGGVVLCQKCGQHEDYCR